MTASTTTRSIMIPGGQIGVQGDDGKVQECLVHVAGHLANDVCSPGHNDEHCRYTDKVQVFDFDQFQVKVANENEVVPTRVPLREWMEQVKRKIEDNQDCVGQEDDTSDEAGKNDDNDSDDEVDVRAQSLLALHDAFVPVVQEILQGNYQFYQSALQNVNRKEIRVDKYARPNYRSAANQYAQYLHNDAWISAQEQQDDDDDQQDCYYDIAMVNIWFVLNPQPPTNSLVFYECDARHTKQSHMLHAQVPHTAKQTVWYDATMSWGRFYLFVAGQVDTADRVLLHGAMEVAASRQQGEDAAPGRKEDTTTTLQRQQQQDKEVRRSIEMRYMLRVPKK